MVNRSRLRRWAVLGLVCLTACTGKSDGDAPAADLILHNGRIYTANATQDMVQALAVQGDRLLAVGTDEAVMALRSSGSKVVDLQGKLVLPGLHDTHIHASGIIRYDSCNLESKGVDLLELSEFVGACLARMELPAGEWLTVRQWSFGENNRPAGGLETVRQALDAVASGVPVILLGNDGHHHATNSYGLSLARDASGKQLGLSGKTLQENFPDLIPFVGMDAAGEPNGAINEGVYRVLGAPGLIDADVPLLAEHVEQIPARLNALGITSMQDAAVAPSLQQLYDALLEQGPLSLRIRLAQYLLPEEYRDENSQLNMPALLADAARTRDKYAALPNISANTLKYFVDGVLEGNPLATPPTLPNAAVLQQLHQPRFALAGNGQTINLLGYVDTDGPACTAWRGLEKPDQASVQSFMLSEGFHPGQCEQSSGVMYAPAGDTLAFAKAADAAGFAVHFHAIGDRSVRTAVDAIEAVTAAGVTLNRHSITHLQLVSDQDITRLGRLKIPLAFTYAWARRFHEYDVTVIPFIEKLDDLGDMYQQDSYYYRHFYPARSIQSAGGILAAGSDAPVETDDPRPFENIEAAVSRDAGQGIFNRDEQLEIRDAIDAYTINGAKLMGQQSITGSLEAGKKADFVVLQQDIIALFETGNARAIHDTRVLQTWFDGRLVYENTSTAGE